MSDLKTRKKILVLAPHADDAEIGMGGSIVKFIQLGYDVKIVNIIIPCEDFNGVSSILAKERRENEAKISAGILGVTMEILDIDPYDFKFNRFYTKMFDKIIYNFKPDEIFMTWEYDSHQDHQVLASIVFSATRKNNCSLYMYETMLPGGISSKSFRPQLFVDISDFIETKRSAVDAYESVFGQNSLSKAIVDRASFRGGQIGVAYAESFEVVKQVVY